MTHPATRPHPIRTVVALATAAALALASCGVDEATDGAAPATTAMALDGTESATSTMVIAPDGTALTVSPSDPLLEQQWGLAATNVPLAWSQTGGAGITIAIVDSGVDLDHPDLVDRLLPGRDFVDGDDEPDDPNGHGTHVAGIAAASSNNLGVAGAAPLASILPVRVLDANGAGSDETIAEAIRWAADNGADVINLSLGESGFISRLTRGSSLNRAIREVAAEGVVVIAAAGNEGTAGQRYRIGVDVLVVNATDQKGSVAEFSNVGDVRSISAPGVEILSTAPTEPTAIWPSGTNGYEVLDGTSMATPLVSGIAALALAAGVDPTQLIDVLLDTAANPSGDVFLGAGIVDASAALGLTPTVPGPHIVPPVSMLPDVPAAEAIEEALRHRLVQAFATR